MRIALVGAALGQLNKDYSVEMELLCFALRPVDAPSGWRPTSGNCCIMIKS